jgi:putative flavoprotein involved in K+ transport
VVVGAGAAGLSAAGALRRRGRRPVVLERAERLGAAWTGRYARLRLHTIRPLSGLAHRPIPAHYPWYVPKDLYARYLEEYAAHFRLDVRLGCAVRAIEPGEGGPAAGWRVETSAGAWRCRVVVVALGRFGRPVIPDWPGQEAFGGRLLHSSAYASGHAYAGQRVLVVGAGNSGTEIAADLAEQGAAAVAISVRAAPPIVRRDMFGLPVQLFGLLLALVPAGAADWLSRQVASLTIGDLTRYGLARPAWGAFGLRRAPTIDTGFLDQLRGGRVAVRPAVVALTPTGVRYQDGREESFDAVVAATGYASGLADLLAPGALDEGGLPLGRSGEPTAHPGLYFVGYTESLRGHLFETNLDSQRLARRVADYLGPAA